MFYILIQWIYVNSILIMYNNKHAWVLNRIQLFVTPCALACQASLSMGVSRQEYWSGFSCPPQGISLTPGSNLHLLRLLYQPRVLYCQCHLGSSKGIGDRQVSLFISRCHHCSLVWHGTPKVISKVSSHFKVFWIWPWMTGLELHWCEMRKLNQDNHLFWMNFLQVS